MSGSWSWSRLTCAALVVAFTVAGCASGGASTTPSTQPLPVVPALVLPTPTGKQLDKSAAAAKYKAIVAPHDKAAIALDDARNQQKPANEVRQLVGTVIKTTDDMLVQLAAVAWPDAVKDSMRVFVNALVGNRQAWSNAAHTSYDVDFWLLLDDAIGRCIHDAQGSVSRALGVTYAKSCQAGNV